MRTSNSQNWLHQAEYEALTEAQYDLLLQKGYKPARLCFMTKAGAYREIKRIISEEKKAKRDRDLGKELYGKRGWNDPQCR